MFVVIDAGVPDGFALILMATCGLAVPRTCSVLIPAVRCWAKFWCQKWCRTCVSGGEDRPFANHRHNVGLHDLCDGNWLLRGLPVCCEESPQGLEEQVVPVSRKKISCAKLPAPRAPHAMLDRWDCRA